MGDFLNFYDCIDLFKGQSQPSLPQLGEFERRKFEGPLLRQQAMMNAF